MTIKQIKKEMLEWRDFYGGDIIYTDEIEKAKSKAQLKDIIDRYGVHLEMVAVDAQSHLDNFKKKTGLDLIF